MDKLSVLKSRDKLNEVGIGNSNDLTRRQRSKLDMLSRQNKRGCYKGGKLLVVAATVAFLLRRDVISRLKGREILMQQHKNLRATHQN